MYDQFFEKNLKIIIPLIGFLGVGYIIFTGRNINFIETDPQKHLIPFSFIFLFVLGAFLFFFKKQIGWSIFVSYIVIFIVQKISHAEKYATELLKYQEVSTITGSPNIAWGLWPSIQESIFLAVYLLFLLSFLFNRNIISIFQISKKRAFLSVGFGLLVSISIYVFEIFFKN